MNYIFDCMELLVMIFLYVYIMLCMSRKHYKNEYKIVEIKLISTITQ